MKKIILLETLKEGEIFWEYYKDNKNILTNSRVVTFSPKAYLFLKEKGIQSESSLRYFSTQSHKNCLLRLEEIISFIEKEFNSCFFKEGLRNSFIFYTRFFIAHLLWMIEVIKNIYQENEITCLSAVVYKDLPVDSHFIDENECYLGVVARKFSIAYHLHFDPINANSFAKKSKNSCYSYNFIDKITAHIYKVIVKIIRNRKTVAVNTLHHRIESLIQEIKEKYKNTSFILLRSGKRDSVSELGFALAELLLNIFGKPFKLSPFNVHLNCAFSLPILSSIFDTEKDRKEFDSRFYRFIKTLETNSSKICYYQINFFELLKKKWLGGHKPFLTFLQRGYGTLAYLISELQPNIVLASYARDLYFILGEICRNLNSCGVLISHGSHIPPKNKWEKIEHDHLGRGLINTLYPYIACQSPWAEKYAGYFSVKSKILRTGPVIWSKFTVPDKKYQAELLLKYQCKKIILHAATQKTKRSMRFYIYETAEEYVESINDLIEAIKELKDVLLIVRFRPTTDLSLEDLKKFLLPSERVIISVKEPFAKVLSVSDLLVSFSSTTIEEALQNRIPVLQYGGRGRYFHIPCYEINSHTLLKNRYPVYGVREKHCLKSALYKILKIHNGVPLTDQELNGHIFKSREIISFLEFIGDNLNNKRCK